MPKYIDLSTKFVPNPLPTINYSSTNNATNIEGNVTITKNIDVSGSSFVSNLYVSKNVDVSGGLAISGLVSVKNMNVINCDLSNCHISKIYERVYTYLDTVNFVYDFATATSSSCILPVTNLTANFNVILTNIPTDTTKLYSVSFLFRQATSCFYIGGIRASDTGGNYLCGTSTTFSPPFYNGGTPSLTSTSATSIIQSFSIPSFYDNSTLLYKRPVLSSVNSHF
jgi:hypothetical protein